MVLKWEPSSYYDHSLWVVLCSIFHALIPGDKSCCICKWRSSDMKKVTQLNEITTHKRGCSSRNRQDFDYHLIRHLLSCLLTLFLPIPGFNDSLWVYTTISVAVHSCFLTSALKLKDNLVSGRNLGHPLTAAILMPTHWWALVLISLSPRRIATLFLLAF